jgi:hypothetical protein
VCVCILYTRTHSEARRSTLQTNGQQRPHNLVYHHQTDSEVFHHPWDEQLKNLTVQNSANIFILPFLSWDKFKCCTAIYWIWCTTLAICVTTIVYDTLRLIVVRYDDESRVTVNDCWLYFSSCV